jgi:iron complex transport system substrate-binding protein
VTLVAAALLFGAAAPVPVPARIMSLNICTDQLLLSLVPPARIASVTFLAREQAPLKEWPQAARIPVNYGSAEEILALHPDLVLAGPFLPPLVKTLLARSGTRLVEVPLAENFGQIRGVTRLVAEIVGEKAKGEALIARMDADLAEAAAQRPARPARVAEWGNGGHVPGGSGLFGALLTQAGARSIAGGDGYDVETLLAEKPDALIFSDTYRGLASLRDEQDAHPALKLPRIYYSSYYSCGVPQLGATALKLERDLARAVRR